MATTNLINESARFSNTNHRDEGKMQMHIAAYGCVFLAPGATRVAQVVPATNGWTVPTAPALKKNH